MRYVSLICIPASGSRNGRASPSLRSISTSRNCASSKLHVTSHLNNTACAEHPAAVNFPLCFLHSQAVLATDWVPGTVLGTNNTEMQNSPCPPKSLCTRRRVAEVNIRHVQSISTAYRHRVQTMPQLCHIPPSPPDHTPVLGTMTESKLCLCPWPATPHPLP